MEFVRKNNLLHKMLLVDGVGRSGKVMLAEILTGYETVEKQDYHEFLEYIPLAYKYKKISKDIAISILQTQVDTELYKSMIGRGINTRLTDYTSLYNYHSPSKYLRRAIDEDGPIVASKVKSEKPTMLFWCHDMIQKSDVVFEAFKEKLFLIYINRNPIDIIYEWNKKKFGARVADDPTEMQYIIRHGEAMVPELALGWEDEYLEMNDEARVIKMIYASFVRNFEAIRLMRSSNQIMIVDFERLVTDPMAIVNSISKLIHLSPLPVMEQILVKERCPRDLDQTTFLERTNEIYASAGKKYHGILDELNVLYKQISAYSSTSFVANEQPNL
jgi:hypothetical protein